MRASLAVLASALFAGAVADDYSYAAAPHGAGDEGTPISSTHQSWTRAWVGYPEGLWLAERSQRSDPWSWAEDVNPFNPGDSGDTMKVCYGYQSEVFKLDCQWEHSTGETKWWTFDTMTHTWATSSSQSHGRRVEAENRARNLATPLGGAFWDNTNNQAVTSPITSGSLYGVRISSFISSFLFDVNNVASTWGDLHLNRLVIPLSVDPFVTSLTYNVTFRLWSQGSQAAPALHTPYTRYDDDGNPLGEDVATYGRPYQPGNAQYPGGLAFVAEVTAQVSNLQLAPTTPLRYTEIALPSSWIVNKDTSRYYRISIEALYENNPNFPRTADCQSLGYGSECSTAMLNNPFNLQWQVVSPDAWPTVPVGGYSYVNARRVVGNLPSTAPFRGAFTMQLNSSSLTFPTHGQYGFETSDNTLNLGSYTPAVLAACATTVTADCPASPGLSLYAEFNPSPTPSPLVSPAPSPQPCPCYAALWGPTWAY